MASGRVLQFDHVRGYGFIAAEDGGEDVFLHASVFQGDATELAAGMRVEFEVMAGDRGRKAYAAHLAPDQPELAAAPIVPAQPGPAQLDLGPEPGAPPSAAIPGEPSAELEEEQLCDVLSVPEFSQEITELLLGITPPLRADHVLEVRQQVLEFARKHGWVDV